MMATRVRCNRVLCRLHRRRDGAKSRRWLGLRLSHRMWCPRLLRPSHDRLVNLIRPRTSRVTRWRIDAEPRQAAVQAHIPLTSHASNNPRLGDFDRGNFGH